MKKLNKILIVLFGLMIVSGGLSYLFFSMHRSGLVDISFSGQPDLVVHAELAQTPAQWSKGLMYRTSMPADSGMLFIFPDETPRSFWMKNTMVPLDMIFISAAGKIVDIKNDFQPCTADPCPIYQSAAPAKYVLEVNAGIVKAKAVNLGEMIILEK
jgi:hypothetical protein